MFHLPNLDRITDLLISRAGGYLRNTVREPQITCHVCCTPVPGFKLCVACHKHTAEHGQRLAGSVGALTYAIAGKQSGYAMRGYKGARPPSDHINLVSLLTWTGIGLHGDCASAHAGTPVTHWSTVPSLPHKPGVHPFHKLAAKALPGKREIVLVASQNVADPRAAAAGHFLTTQTLPPSSHVLLLDDTWTQGGHAQSAALALRDAGVGRVSILTTARWLNPGFGDNSEFVSKSLTSDYNPHQCPWTGGQCPP